MAPTGGNAAVTPMAVKKEKSAAWIFCFLFIQLLSLVGSKVSHVAIGFWIYGRTHSMMDFSLVLLCSFLPNILSSFISGPIVDRVPFNKTFMFGDVLSAVIMVMTALIADINTGSFYYLYATIFLVSAISAFQWVSISAYLPELLKGKALVRATGWLSAARSMASIFATSIASLVMATVGPKGVFFFDAATYLLSAYVVFYLIPQDSKAVPHAGEIKFLSDFKAGLKYLKGKQEILALVTLFLVMNFFAGINTNLMTPLFIERYSEKYAGYVLGFLGFGSLLGGIIQTGITRFSGLRYNIPLLMLFIFLENIVIGYFTSAAVSVALVFLLGLNLTLVNTSTTLLLQENVDSVFRGRIFATTRGISWIALPLSQLFCGIISDSLFRRFFPGLTKGVYIGNVLMFINLVAAGLFLWGAVFWKRPEFQKNPEVQTT